MKFYRNKTMSLTLANKITIGRILIIPVFIAAMMSYSPEKEYLRWIALLIYLLAEATDVIDGYIARNFRQKTRAGSILDPLADKLLFISALLCLYKVGSDHGWLVRFPLWLVVAFVSRDVMLLLGSFLIEVKVGIVEIKPNIWGKLTAFLQVVCVIAVFLQFPLTRVIWWTALGATAVSGVIYIKEGVKVLNDGHR
ncbi:MAG: CDP-alcohol phosphatidyltransferase family protein [Candidatus Omnitrophica bacterium]|nr:CDP-alcohol phosphatidyltransferase family protein [Candidatus Omnitrophota bacterium]